MGILQLIASRNFIVLNKDLIKILGLEEAILFGELCSEFDYWEKQNQLKDGFFFSTIENIENNTTLSEHKQRKALNNLKAKNIIEIKIMGIPAKRYIKINEEQVLNFFNCKFLNFSGTRNSNTEEQESIIFQELETQNLSTNNNKVNNNKTNNNNLIKISNADCKEIIDYLNLKAGTKYRYSSNKTQFHINARLNEGFQIEDFKIVIDKKVLDWLHDKDMNKYLRPETLFGTKFESYLNQPWKKVTTKDLINAGVVELSNDNELDTHEKDLINGIQVNKVPF